MLKRGILIIMLLVGAVLGCLSQNGVSSPANYGYLESTGLKLDRRILNNFDERGKKTGLWIDTLQLGALRITNYFAGSRMGLSTTYHPTSLKNAYFPLLQVEYNLDSPEMVAVWYDNRTPSHMRHITVILSLQLAGLNKLQIICSTHPAGPNSNGNETLPPVRYYHDGEPWMGPEKGLRTEL